MLYLLFCIYIHPKAEGNARKKSSVWDSPTRAIVQKRLSSANYHESYGGRLFEEPYFLFPKTFNFSEWNNPEEGLNLVEVKFHPESSTRPLKFIRGYNMS